MEKDNTIFNTQEQLFKIEDFIIRMQNKVERAEQMLQDLTEEYFNMTKETAKKESWKLIAGYEEFSVRANIATDYIYELRQMVVEANKIMEVEWEEYQKRKGVAA